MRKLIQNFNNRLFQNKKIEMKDTILVVGSPRSGTTWLMDILCTIPGYTYIFEPLNPIWYPESFDIGFRSRTYLDENSIWNEGESYLRKIFTGNIANLPIKENIVSDLLKGFSLKNSMMHIFGNKLIVKSVNMNRMIPWICKFFKLKKIFFIIRHPCAVVSSQLKTRFCGYRPNSPPYFDIFPTTKNILEETSEIENIDKKILNKLKNLEKPEEILAVTWCLDNLILKSKPKLNPLKLVVYEKLLTDGEKEIKNIFKNINVNSITRSAYNRLRKPTIVTIPEEKKFLKKPTGQLSKWKYFLSERQIKRIFEIVSYFDIDFYSEDFEPIYENF